MASSVLSPRSLAAPVRPEDLETFVKLCAELTELEADDHVNGRKELQKARVQSLTLRLAFARSRAETVTRALGLQYKLSNLGATPSDSNTSQAQSPPSSQPSSPRARPNSVSTPSTLLVRRRHSRLFTHAELSEQPLLTVEKPTSVYSRDGGDDQVGEASPSSPPESPTARPFAVKVRRTSIDSPQLSPSGSSPNLAGPSSPSWKASDIALSPQLATIKSLDLAFLQSARGGDPLSPLAAAALPLPPSHLNITVPHREGGTSAGGQGGQGAGSSPGSSPSPGSPISLALKKLRNRAISYSSRKSPAVDEPKSPCSSTSARGTPTGSSHHHSSHHHSSHHHSSHHHSSHHHTRVRSPTALALAQSQLDTHPLVQEAAALSHELEDAQQELARLEALAARLVALRREYDGFMRRVFTGMRGNPPGDEHERELAARCRSLSMLFNREECRKATYDRCRTVLFDMVTYVTDAIYSVWDLLLLQSPSCEAEVIKVLKSLRTHPLHYGYYGALFGMHGSGQAHHNNNHGHGGNEANHMASLAAALQHLVHKLHERSCENSDNNNASSGANDCGSSNHNQGAEGPASATTSVEGGNNGSNGNNGASVPAGSGRASAEGSNNGHVGPSDTSPSAGVTGSSGLSGGSGAIGRGPSLSRMMLERAFKQVELALGNVGDVNDSVPESPKVLLDGLRDFSVCISEVRQGYSMWLLENRASLATRFQNASNVVIDICKCLYWFDRRLLQELNPKLEGITTLYSRAMRELHVHRHALLASALPHLCVREPAASPQLLRPRSIHDVAMLDADEDNARGGGMQAQAAPPSQSRTSSDGQEGSRLSSEGAHTAGSRVGFGAGSTDVVPSEKAGGEGGGQVVLPVYGGAGYARPAPGGGSTSDGAVAS